MTMTTHDDPARQRSPISAVRLCVVTAVVGYVVNLIVAAAANTDMTGERAGRLLTPWLIAGVVGAVVARRRGARWPGGKYVLLVLVVWFVAALLVVVGRNS